MCAWDQAHIEHVARYDVTPEEAEQGILNNPLELFRETRKGEVRVDTLSETDAGRVLLVVIAPRGECLRVMTAYPADRRERRYYATQRWWGRYGKDIGDA